MVFDRDCGLLVGRPRLFKAEARTRQTATAAAKSGFVGHRNGTCWRFQIASHVICLAQFGPDIRGKHQKHFTTEGNSISKCIGIFVYGGLISSALGSQAQFTKARRYIRSAGDTTLKSPHLGCFTIGVFNHTKSIPA
jgi:hypothetical protein